MLIHPLFFVADLQAVPSNGAGGRTSGSISGRGVTDPTRRVPILIALSAAFVVSLCLLALDAQTTRAVWREASGLTRGPFIDRDALPLVSTGAAGKRQYTVPDLAPIVGYQDSTGNWHGLEHAYAATLSGSAARNDWRAFFSHLLGRSIAGGAVRLTLDRRLQRVADSALGSQMGAVVALDPRTGAVLAMVSKPDCSPSTLASAAGDRACAADPSKPLVNRATNLPLSPGSDFKIVTLSAALDTRTFSLDSVFSGADAFGPSPYFDNSLYPSNVTRSDLTQLTLPQALAFSDNFTFAHIGLTMGASTLLRYAHRFYVGERIPFDLPTAKTVVAKGEAVPSKSVLAQSSFGGRPDSVTPLQMAVVAETVANRGVLMLPHLVEDLETPSGQVLSRPPPPKPRHVMSPRAARDVTTAMEFVVNHGSGFEAQVQGIKVAGKTGTAESGGDKPNAWFIAFAPADNPVIAVAVLRQFSGEGFEYAAPIARKMLVAGMRLDGIHVTNKPAPTSVP
jgi:penicillin-binding protein A